MFKRLHHRAAYKGSGTGLAIVKLIIRKLNGHIILDSQPGHGSRFILEFVKEGVEERVLEEGVDVVY